MVDSKEKYKFDLGVKGSPVTAVLFIAPLQFKICS